MEPSLSDKIQTFVLKTPEKKIVSDSQPPEIPANRTCGDAHLPLKDAGCMGLSLEPRKETRTHGNMDRGVESLLSGERRLTGLCGR